MEETAELTTEVDGEGGVVSEVETFEGRCGVGVVECVAVYSAADSEFAKTGGRPLAVRARVDGDTLLGSQCSTSAGGQM